MAQLTGINKRTEITYVEIVADDNSAVLMVAREGGKTTLRTRLPHEDRWNTNSPRFTLNGADASLLALVVTGGDASWQADKIKEISTVAFSLPDPSPKVDEAEKARCSELDIERAKAANITEQRELLTAQLIVQHMDDKHIREHVTGCPKCDDKFPAAPSYNETEDGGLAVNEDSMPF